MSIRKVAFEFDPFENVEVPRKNRIEAKQEVADYVKETVLSYVGDAKSPVEGGRWKKSLSAGYKKFKKGKGALVANLELSGEMLDALEVVDKGGKLSLQITGAQAGKADGNNRGTYGQNSSNLSQAREFIPKRGQTFRDSIWSGINSILERFQDDGEN